MEKSYPMTGGDGPCSYSKNSSLQHEAAERAKSSLVGGIVENLDIEHVTSLNTFAIADFGCSTGPNTFIAVDNMIEGIIQKLQRHGYSKLPEFQVFFSDHISNDFNALFANLPTSPRKYFASGVPGSFHGRLFPRASLNFAYSAFALHWLSRAPQELGDPSSPAFNRGRIYYPNAPSEVGEAYAAQYAKDMESFLGARAEEVVSGGLMLLLIPGRPSEVSLGPFFSLLESCLLDMAAKGLVSEDKIDYFNLPIYSPSIDELTTLILNNAHFSIARLDQLPQMPIIPLPSAKECRAGFANIITEHFGSEVIDELFDRYAKKHAEHPVVSAGEGVSSGLFVLLKRN
ncbi:hypothetical protein K2173_026421 [Erythroxylum novogranatense]|uniref:Uncharacterized protein n=1 Tax=Erythroxylum novogranatense TaxID=1862640 RepID=A0AAV8SNC2_9ROSI|nr:hypothetical protein K2173_026421 [Erythroxylum novogranatense]